MAKPKGLTQRDLFLVGGGLGIMLLLVGFLVLGNQSPVDPGALEVSALDNDRLYEGEVNEYEAERRSDRKKRASEFQETDFRPIPALPQHPQIQVYFNQSRAGVYTDPYRQTKRYGDNLEQIVMSEIEQAKVTLDLAVHELNLPGVAQAVAKRHLAGVRVRLIMENTYTKEVGSLKQEDLKKLSEHYRSRAENLLLYIDINQDGKNSPEELSQRDAMYIFNQNRVPWIDDTEDGTRGTGIMHHKYILIDSKTLITGSTNLTFSDVHGDADAPATRGNSNNLLVIRSPELVALYQQDFEEMWGDGPGGLQKNSRFGTKKAYRPPQSISVGGVAVTLAFSPTAAKVPFEGTVNGLINQQLKKATRSIHMALFVFSAQEIADQLLLLKQANPPLEIAGVYDPGFSYRDFSETLDLWGKTLPSRTCTLEEANQPWTTPLDTIGVPPLAEGDKMHHKYAVIDSALIITGSHNWSKAANNANDENTLIINSPLIAAHYEREFERMYKNSFKGPSKKLTEKIATVGSRCPTITQKVSKPKKASLPKATATLTPTVSANTSVNVNTADAAALEQLPGISARTAAAILEYRNTNGPFRSLADLDAVKGIGPKTLEQLQNKVQFEN